MRLRVSEGNDFVEFDKSLISWSTLVGKHSSCGGLVALVPMADIRKVLQCTQCNFGVAVPFRVTRGSVALFFQHLNTLSGEKLDMRSDVIQEAVRLTLDFRVAGSAESEKTKIQNPSFEDGV